MATPTWDGTVAALQEILAEIKAKMDALISASPDALKPSEQAVEAIIIAALDGGALAALRDGALADLKQLVTTGSGPIGGPDATLG